MFGDTKLNPLKWEIATLSEICTEIIDCPHSTPNYVDYETEFPCIRTTELQNGNISWKRMKYLDEVGYKLRIKRLKPQEGDIIYGREGTIGEAALIPKNIKLSLGQRVMLFRANYKLVNNVFLLNVIRSKGLLHQALRKNTGSTVSHVNVKDIKNFKIILPDLELQKQFAEKITLIEQQKELAKQELKESEDLFNCLLQKAFKGELV
nr:MULTISPECIES: restriction endonuclease subunit S [unclassified Flavobacterium]